MLAPESWQGKKDSNLRMPESKSGALGQLGDSPPNFWFSTLMLKATGVL